MATLYDKAVKIKTEKDEKIIPSNIRKDVTIYGVTGTLDSGSSSSSNIKLFSSREEMLRDSSVEDNTFGVVYEIIEHEVKENDETDNIMFVNSFILDEALSNLYFSIWSGNISIDIYKSGSSISVNLWTSSGSTEFNYTTEDNLTYTSSDTSITGKYIDLGKKVKFESIYEAWNPAISKMLMCKNPSLEGVYKYEDKIDDEYCYVITSFDSYMLSNTDTTGSYIRSTNEQRYLPYITSNLKRLFKDNSSKFSAVITKENSNYYVYLSSVNEFYHSNDKKLYIRIFTDREDEYKLILKYKIDPTGVVPEYVATLDGDDIGQKFGDLDYVYIEIPYNEIVGYFNGDGSIGGNIDLINTENGRTMYWQSASDHDNFYFQRQSIKTWHRVESSINLCDPSQLFSGVTALGKYGILTGDDTLYNYLDPDKILNTYYSLSKNDRGSYIGIPQPYYILAREDQWYFQNQAGHLLYFKRVLDGETAIWEDDKTKKYIIIGDDLVYDENKDYDVNKDYNFEDWRMRPIICNSSLSGSATFYTNLAQSPVITDENNNKYIDLAGKLSGRLYLDMVYELVNSSQLTSSDNYIACVMTYNAQYPFFQLIDRGDVEKVILTRNV